jgi:hypothetical protein
VTLVQYQVCGLVVAAQRALQTSKRDAAVAWTQCVRAWAPGWWQTGVHQNGQMRNHPAYHYRASIVGDDGNRCCTTQTNTWQHGRRSVAAAGQDKAAAQDRVASGQIVVCNTLSQRETIIAHSLSTKCPNPTSTPAAAMLVKRRRAAQGSLLQDEDWSLNEARC